MLTGWYYILYFFFEYIIQSDAHGERRDVHIAHIQFVMTLFSLVIRRTNEILKITPCILVGLNFILASHVHIIYIYIYNVLYSRYAQTTTLKTKLFWGNLIKRNKKYTHESCHTVSRGVKRFKVWTVKTVKMQWQCASSYINCLFDFFPVYFYTV